MFADVADKPTDKRAFRTTQGNRPVSSLRGASRKTLTDA
jgi:hypothetical protein